MTGKPGQLHVVVRGAGDLGSGVIFRLWRVGFQPVALERKHPRTVRRRVAFASAIHEQRVEVEGIKAERTRDPSDCRAEIPVLVDPEGAYLSDHSIDVLVDCTMARTRERIRTSMDDAFLTIALGPGFRVGEDVDYVIETKRGHDLGRVLSEGEAEPSTGVPGNIGGKTSERLVRAPTDGVFQSECQIGDRIEADQEVGTVDGTPVRAGVGGVIRGLIYPGTPVREGLKLGDVDPRGRVDYVDRISDKARAVGGGVLEAIGYDLFRRGRIDALTRERSAPPTTEP